MQLIRSLLYVPASSERFIAKAHDRGADAIILDLEDAVVPTEKPSARARLPAAVASAGQRGAVVFVRINSQPDLVWLDAEAAARAGAFGLFVPKARDAATLRELAAVLETVERSMGRPAMALVPMIEDPGAVLDARAIAGATSRVHALVAGGEDLATSLDAEPTPEVLSSSEAAGAPRRQSGGRAFVSASCARSQTTATWLPSRKARRRRARSVSTGRVASIRAWCRFSTAPSPLHRKRSIERAACLPRPKWRRRREKARSRSRARWSTSP